MDVFAWLEKHNPNEKGIRLGERYRRSILIDWLCKKAGTKRQYLNNSKYRGSIGRELLNRLIEASKDFKDPITKGTGKRHGCNLYILKDDETLRDKE